MSARPYRMGDVFAPQPGDRIILLIVVTMMVAILMGLMFALGVTYQRNHFLTQCDAGEKFHALGDPDIPYRCTRVIDYPPIPRKP